ncbi:ImmA/IrrE family metallo-endopeptidase [Clostridium butyricum]|uniref:ImmA/IrrE family metallo-endopeptidase n=1 Tax=Clostridium butyricum TaxID=1492 RepID=UPI003465C099
MSDSLTKSRKIARRVFEKEGLSIPVDIENLIKKNAEWHNEDIPYKGDAICVNRKENPIIFTANDTPLTRLRFTLAHELGHIKIPWHIGMIACHIDNESTIARNEYEEMENEANTFASELLMPQSWLKKKLVDNNGAKLLTLISIISEEAAVSFLATLYAIINVLPQGYVVFVKQHDWTYEKKILSENTNLLCMSEIDKRKWFKEYCDESELIERAYETVYCYKFNNRLSQEKISELIKDNHEAINLDKVFKKVFEQERENPVVILPIIIKHLPEGYVIGVYSKKFDKTKYLKSEGTTVYPKYIDEDQIDDWYNENSVEYGEFEQEHFVVKWWRFEVYMEFDDSEVSSIQSKDIFSDILNKYGYCGKERSSINGKVNGTIGNLKNRIGSMTREQFYSILKQKFTGRHDIKTITEDENFDKFLKTKTFELYNN